MTDVDLFSALAARQAEENAPGLARADHPDTSAEAALAVTNRSGEYKVRILRALAEQGAMTADLLEDFVGLRGNTVRPRLSELRDAGLVRSTDEKRHTRTGSWARCQEITERGHYALQHIDKQGAKK